MRLAPAPCCRPGSARRPVLALVLGAACVLASCGPSGPPGGPADDGGDDASIADDSSLPDDPGTDGGGDRDVRPDRPGDEGDAAGDDAAADAIDAPVDVLPPCTTFFRDDDGDGFGTADTRCLAAPESPHTATIGGDCDDNDGSVHPGAGEDCLTGWDDDCDDDLNGRDGLGCRLHYPDADGDGAGADDGGECWCTGFPGLSADRSGDCEDDDPFVHPGVAESCDGRDEDCDGATDEDGSCPPVPYHCDGDGDGHGSASASGSCAAFDCVPDGCAVTAGDDCDDGDAAVHPGAAEACNGRDDDCGDGADEDGACVGQAYFCDADGDGRPSATPSGTCSTWGCVPAGCEAAIGDDCDDGDASVHPGAAEICNGHDEDCAGGADDGGACPRVAYFCDADADGHPAASPTGACGWFACVPAGCGEASGDDCDDGDSDVRPGRVETCNGVDDDCSGVADDGEACPSVAYFCDLDGDGERAAAATGACRGPACVPAGCAEWAGPDCDDGDPAVHPGAAETCDGRDDDCDGVADGPGVCPAVDWFCDLDGDGARSAEPTGRCDTFRCVPAGCETDPGDDCNDQDVRVHPGRPEDCATPADDGCDGSADAEGAAGCIPWYADGDGDGFGVDGAPSQCRCGPAEGFTAPRTGDCDDTSPDTNPAAAEGCNGLDDDCDDAIDEDGACLTVLYYCDVDGDFYVASQPTGRCEDVALVPEGCRTTPGRDCDDADPAVHPGAPEDCATPADDDCNGSTDARDARHCGTWYRDLDQDGYGIATDGQCRCAPLPPYTAPLALATDCADSNPSIHPGAIEACNGIDDDCDGIGDGPGACPPVSWYCDRDGDGAFSRSPGGTCDSFQCVPPGCRDEAGADCDDADGAVWPGAAEACNGIDDDCDGVRDGGGVCPAVAYWCDADGDGVLAATPSGTCWTFACLPAGCGTSPGTDCDDRAAAVHPGAAETCNGVDDDCDGAVDGPGACVATAYFCDADRDAHAAAIASGTCDRFGCVPAACGTAAGDDCNDNDLAVHPGVPEACNGIDDDCAGGVDDGGVCPLQSYYCDRDGDGHRALAPTGTCGAYACVPAGCGTTPGDDCDDGQPATWPGAPEPCDGRDDDCDGSTDEGNCVIGGRCVDAGLASPDDPCLWCDPALDPLAWSPGEGRACDDGHAYTVGDTCNAGACVGTPASCFADLRFGDSCRLQSLQVGTDGTPGEGLDVDGNPATCKPDGTSGDGQPLCSAGIDNQLSLVDEVLNPELERQVRVGWIHLLADLDAPGPGPFRIAFFLGRVTPGAPACDITLPGCDYEANASGFDAACTPLYALDNATLQGTHLSAGGPGYRIALSMPLVGSTVVTLTIRAARLEATATLAGGHVTAFDGILAGALPKADLFAALAKVPDADLPLPRDQILALLNLLLKPDIDGDGDGVKESISMGLKIRADVARITGVYLP